ncbi:MAG: protein kinase [Lentisphaeraceae bacterium]|nr:protein kinase [Lentisphaeraceae bacterium]
MGLSQAEKYAGKYPLIKLLGKGGMGEVWLSHHPGLDIPVAVKLLKAFNSEAQLNRFIQEGRLAASINHDNIVRVYDADSDGDEFFLVMEYIKGEDYKGFATKNGGSLSIEQGLEMALAVCSALSKAHEKKIFHRDIKPENIMRSEKGDIKLADLGIAKREDADFQNTMANTPLGTPYYMSPEQASDASTVDCRTDIYSLGATLYYLLTGTYPFNAKTPIQMLMKHINESLEEPAKRNPKIPQELSQIICKMMEKDREDRYQNCDELHQKLLDFKRSYKEEDFAGETLEDIKLNATKEAYDETLVQTQDQSSPVLSSTKASETQNSQDEDITQSAETLNYTAGNEPSPEKQAMKFLPLYVTLAVIFLMFIIYMFKGGKTGEDTDSANIVSSDQGVTDVLELSSAKSEPILSPNSVSEIKQQEVSVPKPVVKEVPLPKAVIIPQIAPVPKPVVKEIPKPKPEKKAAPKNENAEALSQIYGEIKTAYNLLDGNKILSYLQRYTHPIEAKKYGVAIDSVYLNWFKMYQNDMMLDAFKEMNASKPVHVSKDLVSFKISQKFSKYLINSGYLPNVNIQEVDQYVNFKKYNGKWYISEDERNPLVKYTNPVYEDLATISSMLKHRKLRELLLRYTHPLEKREMANNLAILQNNQAYLLYTVICLNLQRQNAIPVNDNAVTFKAIEDQYLNFQKYNGKWYVMDDETKPF